MNIIEIEYKGKQQTFQTEEEFNKFLIETHLSVDSDNNLVEKVGAGVVPSILDQWFSERIEYRKLAKEYSDKGDKEKSDFYNRRQLRQKIFLNSVYGTLGLPIFRFYDRDNAEAVTISGQQIIRSAEKLVNDMYITTYKDKGIVPPKEDFVVYIDTDSLYVSSLPLAKLEKNVLDMTQFTIDLADKVATKINRFYEYMVPFIFNVDPRYNRIKIVPDVVAKKALWVVKKRYTMLKVYDMEKRKPVKDKKGGEGKLEVKGIDVVRSSFPFAFRKFAGDMLDSILRGVPREELDERIMKFEENIESYSINDLAKTSSVKFISTNGVTDYNPTGRKLFQFVTGSPVQVRAALSYNDLIKVWKLDKQFEKLTHSEKIKWVYLLPNEFYIEQLAMKGDDTDPDQILNFIIVNIDRRKMYERELKSKLEEIYTVIGWQYPSRGSQLSSGTFDFNDEW